MHHCVVSRSKPDFNATRFLIQSILLDLSCCYKYFELIKFINVTFLTLRTVHLLNSFTYIYNLFTYTQIIKFEENK